MSLKEYTTGETVIHSGSYRCSKTNETKNFAQGETFTTCPKDNRSTRWILIE